MDKLDKILNQSIAKKPIKKTLDSAYICFLADKWSKGRFTAIAFSNGILKVSVGSSPAASELQFKEVEIIDFINEKAGRNVVKSVRILINRM